MKVSVYVDFDGTIAPDDPTDALFDRFADPSWRDIEARWQRGLITARECMRSQVGLISATQYEMDQFLATVRIDPAFPSFVRSCHRRGFEVMVVSDGFELIVGTVLRASGLDLPFAANRLVFAGGRNWALEPRAPRLDCRQQLGNCKCSHRASGSLHIAIGDGRSDFCVAQRSDLILAKDKLAEHCREMNLPHVPIDDFSEAWPVVSQWVRPQKRPALLQVAEEAQPLA